MKLKSLLALLILGITQQVNAQNTFPGDGNVGVGTGNPAYKFQIAAGHGNTHMNLHFANANLVQDAHLSLWASEPGWTWTGAGIGNNVFNSATAPGIVRINDLRGASYIRLLDQEIRLNVIKADGTDLSALAVDAQGNIGMGTLTPKEKLSVNGNIRAKEVKVEAGNWPDFVFEANYKITSLAELEKYIKAHKHLPDMPSAKEVSEQGIELGELNKKLLQKMEELTLHLIEKEKQIDALQNLVEKQRGNIK
ncbi:hypothetical protein [Pedobacter rhizosphaerae]|uniref:Uncharacterized protein n=1 Tax=Pedobacter rhizosphaerae TaxID=390241 RepID=A0A1H9VFH6_9SPHI|nr:hypothetical protein [Pedobacter rhizosphaerae]SES20445.1 hypothetical protein SAMN04488023_14231 [Pedobacter rhizosphaerae]